MKKPNKRDSINLFFSAFLVLAFIICAHFFTQFTSTLSSTVGSIISILLYVVFGLLLFYATRVGDGKAVKRFSIITLIIMVIPSLYIIIASLAPGMPLNSVFASDTPGGVSMIAGFAAVALGYGVPYTFLSGFEIADSEAEETAPAEETESAVLEGGVEADLIADGETKEEAKEEETEQSEASEENDETDSESQE